MSTQHYLNDQTETDVLEIGVEEKQLIVYNDEVNTFDWVIQSLIEICQHTPEQAEQCTLLIHYRGKASVRHGSVERLEGMKNGLLDRGISAEIS